MLAPKSVTLKSQRKKSSCIAKKPKMNPQIFLQNSSRGDIEKDRRQKMKTLYSRLASVLPLSSNQEKLPLPALLDGSLGYVKYLKERVELLKTRKEGLKEDMVMAGVELNEMGSLLEVNLVTGLNKGFILPKVIRILEEEGAQVLSANYSSLKDRILYSITSQALSTRVGVETSNVQERLKMISGIGFAPPVIKRESLDALSSRMGKETSNVPERLKMISGIGPVIEMETFDLQQFQRGESYAFSRPSSETLDLRQFQGESFDDFCMRSRETLDFGQFQGRESYSFCWPSRETLDVGQFPKGEY